MSRPVGLRWHARRQGGKRALWRASRRAVKAGFPVTCWTLWSGDEPTAEELKHIENVCRNLAAEQQDWLKGMRCQLGVRWRRAQRRTVSQQHQ